MLDVDKVRSLQYGLTAVLPGDVGQSIVFLYARTQMQTCLTSRIDKTVQSQEYSIMSQGKGGRLPHRV